MTGLNQLLACDCEYPKPIMEFYSAEHVFEGKVISKTYTKDSLHFTVRLEALKHYKVGNNPKYMDFTFSSEGRFTGVITSCDWFVEKNENWLVFTEIRNSRLTFNPMCSNSQLIKDGISKQMRDLLVKANSFNIHDYIFNPTEIQFNSISNVKLDSLVGKIRKKLMGEPESLQLVMIIDEQGELEKVNAYFRPPYNIYKDMKFDSIYGLIRDYSPKKRDSLKEIELNLIESISLLKTWNILSHKKTNVPVKYYLSPVLIYNEDISEWKILGN
ncbi:hypothetical protein QWY87_10585 [Lutimonas halocynthiae]|uniref:hypothetical protein n=1 Tax=Lutimonas halocynthiae TaxID=1446477 RepID=UPI0025B2E5D1|nr:hypothetical protein [Lutimonas halocynthiae]MDN3643148.1 hypothetical protein [Lutimonas halocynthiae]